MFHVASTDEEQHQQQKQKQFPSVLCISSNTTTSSKSVVVDNTPSSLTSPSPPSDQSGGIHGCVRFSTKYEARYILPWLHYHHKLGISHFHLYFDSISSTLSNPIEGKAYSLISTLPYVTIYDQYAVGFDTEYLVLDHCVTISHIPFKGEWVMEFDIDEVIAFHERLLNAPPNCNDPNEKAEYDGLTGALTRFITSVPSTINAVVVPRIQIRTSNITFPPPELGQYELYIDREYEMCDSGKILFRTSKTGRTINKLRSKHEVWTTIPNSVSYPDGILIKPTNCEEDGYCLYQFNSTQLLQDQHLANTVPFLYHYVTRSSSECYDKLNHLPSDNWRVMNSEYICADRPNFHKYVSDYGVYCYGYYIRHELEKLYPNHKSLPYIF